MMDPHFLFSHSDVIRSAEENVTEGPVGDEGLENLYPALVQCFGIILLGYLAGKFSFINDVEAKGLGTFVGTFSLPALIFVSLCQLDFSSVNWMFLLAISISKTVVFFVVLIIGLFIGPNLSKTALYAIFTTQSNDFALGFPVLNAIYGKSHPDYPMYLYLLSPVSLALLNPIGFILMEIGRSRAESVQQQEGHAAKSKWRIARKVVKGIITNPLLFMTFAGIFGNLLFHHVMPSVIHGFMATLGSAFSASALFLLGLRMVGKSVTFSGSQALVIPFILIMVKSLVLPLITREIVSQMNPGADVNETLNLANYGFLYGTIPTAPSVFVYATNYEIVPELVAATITASTFIAAPIMFISAKLLTINNLNPVDYIDEIDTFLFDISIIGLLAAVWVVFVLTITKKAYTFPHQLTLILVICQGLACTGAILWSFLDCREGWRLYIQFIIFGFGVLGSRVSTAMLALTLLLHAHGVATITRFRRYILAVSLGLPLVIVTVLTVVVAVETPPHSKKADPNFQYGPTQAITALVIIVVSLITTIVCLIIRQRIGKSQWLPSPTNNRPPDYGSRRYSGEADRLLRDSPDIDEEEEVVVSRTENTADNCCEFAVGGGGGGETGSALPPDMEDLIRPLPRAGAAAGLARPGGGAAGLPCTTGRAGTRRYRCDSTHREYCHSLIRRYEIPPGEDALSPDNVLGINSQLTGLVYQQHHGDPLDLVRHSLLLVILCISMFVGGALCTWTLLMDSMSGIYLELVFLDGFLNLGQPILTCALFGINTRGIYLQLRVLLRKLIYRREKIILPAWEDLDADDRAISTLFIKHHVALCMEQVLHDISQGLRRHLAAFYGTELVTWLVERRLAQTRQEGEMVGRQLLRGRVIRHVDDHIDFYDDSYVYTFLPENRRLRN